MTARCERCYHLGYFQWIWQAYEAWKLRNTAGIADMAGRYRRIRPICRQSPDVSYIFRYISSLCRIRETPEPWYSNVPGFSIPVRAGGVEPPRAYTHCHLKTARLPFRHARRQSTNLHLFTPSNKSACRDWRTSTKRPHQTACSALYCVPQSFIASMIGCSVRPVSVSEYSTRGGTSGYTSRCTNPSRSI